MSCHKHDNNINAIVPQMTSIVDTTYSVILSSVVGRAHTASIIARVYEHVAIVSMIIISINFLITISFRLIIKKRLPFVYTLGGITQHALLHVLVCYRYGEHSNGTIITNVMLLYVLSKLRVRKRISNAII